MCTQRSIHANEYKLRALCHWIWLIETLCIVGAGPTKRRFVALSSKPPEFEPAGFVLGRVGPRRINTDGDAGRSRPISRISGRAAVGNSCRRARDLAARTPAFISSGATKWPRTQTPPALGSVRSNRVHGDMDTDGSKRLRVDQTRRKRCALTLEQPHRAVGIIYYTHQVGRRRSDSCSAGRLEAAFGQPKPKNGPKRAPNESPPAS